MARGESVNMAAALHAAVVAEVLSWLSPWLDALRTPLGMVLFVPLYGLWVTLLLPGVWASIVLGSACSMKMEMGRAMNSRLRDA